MYKACTTIEEFVVVVNKFNSMWPSTDIEEDIAVTE
jgi:hypothetical protein